jgi:1-acyl-sn-glycerol-3-phosphate acyltransferase
MALDALQNLAVTIVGFAAFSKVFFYLLRLTSPRIQFYSLLVYANMTLLTAFIYSIATYPIFYFFRRVDLMQYTTSKLWWYITAPIVGIRIEIQGETGLWGWGGRKHNSKGPCIFVANHQSELDILLQAIVSL